MKVKATQRGYYGALREAGDVFQISSEEHLGDWMEPVDGDAEVQGSTAIEPVSESPRPPVVQTLDSSAQEPLYVARHKGGKTWGVWHATADSDADWVSDFKGTEEEAEAEAARLNAGGDSEERQEPERAVGPGA